MNIFLILIKQLRQRALSSWLTTLSVLLGVALGIAVLVAWREGERLFAQSDFGIDLVVGPRSSSTQLVMNSLYHMDESPGVISYSFYERMQRGGPWFKYVRQAAPLVVGDSYKQYRLIGTSPRLFGFADDGTTPLDVGAFEARLGQPYKIAEGRIFVANKFEAVLGFEVAKKSGLKIGDTFQATHGLPNASEVPDIHAEKWLVVGTLAQTHTANDRVIFMPLQSLFAIAEHEEGIEKIQERREKEDTDAFIKTGKMNSAYSNIGPLTGGGHQHHAAESAGKKSEETKSDHQHNHDDHDHNHDAPYVMNADGTFTLKLPKEDWLVSAILVKTRGPSPALQLYDELRTNREAMAAYPAKVMRDFFDTFFAASLKAFLLVASLVIVVAGVSILVSIYNSISGRMQEIAIMRALGATKMRIVLLICLEAGFIGAVGAFLGLIAGHVLIAAVSIYLNSSAGVNLNAGWVSTGELLYCLSVVILSALAGAVPALKAYQVPVAENL